MAVRVSMERLSGLLTPEALRSRTAWLAFIAVLVASMVVAVALRGAAWGRWLQVNKHLPVPVYIDAFDPWIEYWLAKYLYEHGLGSWWSLHPPNPAVMKFWYPWGRDFTRTEYPLVPMLIAATYPLGRALGFTFQQWAAWIPAVFGGVLVLAAAVLAAKRFGPLPGIVAAVAIALLPANATRTLLGFIEKEGITLSIAVFSVLASSLTLEHIDDPLRRRIYALVAGLLAALVGLGWGGYLLPIGVFVASMLLLPAAGVRVKPEYADAPILYWVGLLPAMLFSRWRGIHALLVVPGGLVLATAALVALLGLVYRLLETRRAARSTPVRVLSLLLENKIVYLVIFVVVGSAVFTAAAMSRVFGARVAYLLLPGYLKEVLIEHAGPLVASVAEHYPDIHRLVSEASAPLLGVAVIGILYMLYRVVARGEKGDLPILVAAAVTYYAMFNAAYFTQTGSVFATIAAAAASGIAYEHIGRGARGARRRVEHEAAWLLPTLGVILALISIAGVAYATAPRIGFYVQRLPMLLTSSVSVNTLVPSWYNALLYIRRHTSPDTVVVSWWDYGYWISVFGERPSLADGATINATQIHLLARILVGPYTEAVKLLKKLKCKPGKTLIVAFAVYALEKNGGTLVAIPVVGAGGDLGKSYWMIRIGGLPLNEYMTRVRIMTRNGIVEQWLFTPWSRGFQNALLYRLLMQAPLMLRWKNVVKLMDRNVAELVNSTSVTVVRMTAPVGGAVQLATITGPVLQVPKGFKPYLVSAYTLTKRPGFIIAVIVAAYEWVG